MGADTALTVPPRENPDPSNLCALTVPRSPCLASLSPGRAPELWKAPAHSLALASCHEVVIWGASIHACLPLAASARAHGPACTTLPLLGRWHCPCPCLLRHPDGPDQATLGPRIPGLKAVPLGSSRVPSSFATLGTVWRESSAEWPPPCHPLSVLARVQKLALGPLG